MYNNKVFKSKLFGEQLVKEEIGIDRVSKYEKECLEFLKAYNLSISDAPFYLGGFSSYILLKEIFLKKHLTIKNKCLL